MTRSHAFAMGYKIQYNEWDQRDFEKGVDVPEHRDIENIDAFNVGFELAKQHRKQYEMFHMVYIQSE